MTKYKSNEITKPVQWLCQYKSEYDIGNKDIKEEIHRNIDVLVWAAKRYQQILSEEEKEADRITRMERFNIRNGIKEVIE